jgi:hypothetical protein
MKRNVFALLFFVLVMQHLAKADESSDLSKLEQKRQSIVSKIIESMMGSDDFDKDFFDDSFAQMDQLFEQMRNRQLSLSDQLADQFSVSQAGLEGHWRDEANGRSFVITPHSLDSQLDISVEQGMIKITGKIIKKSENTQSMSQFSNQFSVPSELDANRSEIKQVADKIVIFFPYLEKTPTKEKKPILKKIKGGVPI